MSSGGGRQLRLFKDSGAKTRDDSPPMSQWSHQSVIEG